jgi:hypothetical protein
VQVEACWRGSKRRKSDGGRYFDEWMVGDRIAHDIRRTVTETDNLSSR